QFAGAVNPPKRGPPSPFNCHLGFSPSPTRPPCPVRVIHPPKSPNPHPNSTICRRSMSVRCQPSSRHHTTPVRHVGSPSRETTSRQASPWLLGAPARVATLHDLVLRRADQVYPAKQEPWLKLLWESQAAARATIAIKTCRCP